MYPFSIPYSSFNTFNTGARQLVVQLAALIISSDPSKISSFTLYTIVFKSPLAGADIITFFAPASMWACAFSLSVNNPVHSKTISIPSSFQGSALGSFSEYTLIFLFSTVLSQN